MTRPILLVEDSVEDAELTTAALAENHLANRIVVARDGIEALDYLYGGGAYPGPPAELPVVILLDLKMPGLDGHGVLQRVRAEPTTRHIPVVVMTSSREGPDVARSYELGANAYVVKPVTFAEFIAAVKQIGVFWVLTNEPPA